ncbi:FIG00696938: hypothetical protein [plant metagenome]|uniref:Phage protein Gp138 N-terminal domain-containing protein n=1 Tax=plant metagenome TaxID=1297885 RepID=A0A484U3V5_9ZZZZ
MTDPVTAFRQLIAAELSEIHTSMPGKIISYDGETAVVRPALSKSLANGEVLAPPQIVRVPIHWMVGDIHGAKAVISVPLKAGDDVTLFFSERALETWLQGSDDAPDDPRQFDLSDAYATPILRPGTGQADTENVCVQYGPGSMKLAPDGSLTIRVPRKHVIAEETVFDSRVTVNGPFTYTAGLQGSGGTGGSSMRIQGGIDFQGGTITHNGKNIGSDHSHPNGMGGNTDGPN